MRRQEEVLLEDRRYGDARRRTRYWKRARLNRGSYMRVRMLRRLACNYAGAALVWDFRPAIAAAIEPRIEPERIVNGTQTRSCGTTPIITHFNIQPMAGKLSPGGTTS